MQDVLLAGNSLGSTLKWNALWDSIWWLSLFPNLDGIYIFFQNTTNLLKCPNENKFKAHWILSSEESKIERVTQHLQRLLQLRSRKHWSFKNRGKKSTNGTTLMKEKIKCFACLQGISKWKKKHALFLQTQTSNFQTDSLKAHEVNEASEVHVMTSAAKHESERPREERPLPTLPAA